VPANFKTPRRKKEPAKKTAARVAASITLAELGKLKDEQLLDLRMCDLPLKIEGTALDERIQRVYAELELRRIRYRPHCWLAEEWFSPDDAPGIAIPFFLAHPRLMRLERTMMLDVEGGTQEECLKILRHEAGHAIDTAYRLCRRSDYRRVFGKYTVPYPEFYHPKPFSRSYVLHLDLWYAQSHPVEDFAETFALWLRPMSRWRSQYQDWPALKKLEFVDKLMESLRDQKPLFRSRAQIDPIKSIRTTLREHYDAKRKRYEISQPRFYDRELRRLFSDQPEHAPQLAAATFLRRIRPELRRVVALWTGQYQYIINQLLDDMIERCRELKLRLDRPLPEAERDVLVMLTVQTMNYLHGGHHRVAL